MIYAYCFNCGVPLIQHNCAHERVQGWTPNLYGYCMLCGAALPPPSAAAHICIVRFRHDR